MYFSIYIIAATALVFAAELAAAQPMFAFFSFTPAGALSAP